MGKDSLIEWTDHTWNPWTGCNKVSEGCKNCYMFREQKRFGRDPRDIRRTKTFNDPLKWKSDLVFTCSWSDFFLPEADPWRADAWKVIKDTPHLTYQILTKRPENILERLPDDWGNNGYHNVWLGVSVEAQEYIQRLDWLFWLPAAVKFVSAEPLLGPLDIYKYIFDLSFQWVIVGGESGPNARPMVLDWANQLVAQCQDAGVDVFVKQLGGWPDKRSDLSQFPEFLQVRQMPGLE